MTEYWLLLECCYSCHSWTSSTLARCLHCLIRLLQLHSAERFAVPSTAALYLHICLGRALTTSNALAGIHVTDYCLTLQGLEYQAVTITCAAAADQTAACCLRQSTHIKQYNGSRHFTNHQSPTICAVLTTNTKPQTQYSHSPTLHQYCRGMGIRQSALLPLQLHFRLSHAVHNSILTSSDALVEGYPSMLSHIAGAPGSGSQPCFRDSFRLDCYMLTNAY